MPTYEAMSFDRAAKAAERVHIDPLPMPRQLAAHVFIDALLGGIEAGVHLLPRTLTEQDRMVAVKAAVEVLADGFRNMEAKP